MSACWLCIAVLILIGTYASLPAISDKIWSVTNNSIPNHEPEAQDSSVKVASTATAADSSTHKYLFLGITIILGLSAVSFACYLLGKSALIENEMAIRLSGLADALCIAGGDITQFEKAAAIFVPKTKNISSFSMLSPKELKPLADVLKQLR